MPAVWNLEKQKTLIVGKEKNKALSQILLNFSKKCYYFDGICYFGEEDPMLNKYGKCLGTDLSQLDKIKSMKENLKNHQLNILIIFNQLDGSYYQKLKYMDCIEKNLTFICLESHALSMDSLNDFDNFICEKSQFKFMFQNEPMYNFYIMNGGDPKWFCRLKSKNFPIIFHIHPDEMANPISCQSSLFEKMKQLVLEVPLRTNSLENNEETINDDDSYTPLYRVLLGVSETKPFDEPVIELPKEKQEPVQNHTPSPLFEQKEQIILNLVKNIQTIKKINDNRFDLINDEEEKWNKMMAELICCIMNEAHNQLVELNQKGRVSLSCSTSIINSFRENIRNIYSIRDEDTINLVGGDPFFYLCEQLAIECLKNTLHEFENGLDIK